MTVLRILNRLFRYLRRRHHGFRIDAPMATVRLGSEYGGWSIQPTALSCDSVVYSFGIGEDITFDVALIETYGITVHAFDPTPRSLDWLASQQIPEMFLTHAYGISGQDGDACFFPPVNQSHVSVSVVPRGNENAQGMILPVRRLHTIMAGLGHDHIDLLKLDIEGAEYEVIPDILRSGVDVRQLLVEFHHRFPEFGLDKTRKMLRLLKAYGFRLFSVSVAGEEFSFLREPAATNRLSGLPLA